MFVTSDSNKKPKKQRATVHEIETLSRVYQGLRNNRQERRVEALPTGLARNYSSSNF